MAKVKDPDDSFCSVCGTPCTCDLDEEYVKQRLLDIKVNKINTESPFPKGYVPKFKYWGVKA